MRKDRMSTTLRRKAAVPGHTLSDLKAAAAAELCVSGWPCSTVRTISGHVTPISGLQRSTNSTSEGTQGIVLLTKCSLPDRYVLACALQ